eukprot:scaffold12.g7921.t1
MAAMAQPLDNLSTASLVRTFRVAELQECCMHLGLPKSGRKADLQARILAFMGDEEVTLRGPPARPAREQWRVESARKMIEGVYCRMKGLPPPSGSDQSAATALQHQHQQQHGAAYHQPFHAAAAAPRAMLGAAFSAGGGLLPAAGAGAGGAAGAVGRANTRIRCICQVAVERGAMVQCQLGRPPLPTTSGLQEVQLAERVFFLTQQQVERVQADPAARRVQVSCLSVHDPVRYRFHWPKYAELRLNSLHYRPYSRSLNQAMGVNQRDEPAAVSNMVARGRNSLVMSAAEPGIWVVSAELARRRTLEEVGAGSRVPMRLVAMMTWAGVWCGARGGGVKALMAPPESIDAAVARVRRQVGGGDGGSDDDGILCSHQLPARFSDASGLAAFDLDSYLSMVARNRKWQDPTTLQNSTVRQLQVDAYMQRVLASLGGAPHVTDIEISADGLWRPNGSDGAWHSIAQDPASVRVAPLAAVKPDPEGKSVSLCCHPWQQGGTGMGGADGEDGGDILVSDSETGEEEELRRAAAVVRRSASSAAAGQKRKQPEPEVIELLSSSDDERPAPAAHRPQQLQQQQVPSQQRYHQAQQQCPKFSQQQQAGPGPGLHSLAAAAAAHMQRPVPPATAGGVGYVPMQQSQAAQAQPMAQVGAGLSPRGVAPLRIRLPVRPRPPAHQQAAQQQHMQQPLLHQPAAQQSLGPLDFQQQVVQQQRGQFPYALAGSLGFPPLPLAAYTPPQQPLPGLGSPVGSALPAGVLMHPQQPSPGPPLQQVAPALPPGLRQAEVNDVLSFLASNPSVLED